MGKRLAVVELFLGDMGSIQGVTAFYSKRKSADHANAT